VNLKHSLKSGREALKHFYHRLRLRHHDVSIISNNCWGTRTYQRFGLPYASPFQSLFIFAPDYLQLLDGFSPDKLQIVRFIPKTASKYYAALMQDDELRETPYPIGVLADGTELHFLHYRSADDAKRKWDRRVERINPRKLIFKFSDGYLATEAHIRAFDALAYPNKICFTATAYPQLQSVVHLARFESNGHVELEWKYDRKAIDLHRFFNTIRTDG